MGETPTTTPEEAVRRLLDEVAALKAENAELTARIQELENALHKAAEDFRYWAGPGKRHRAKGQWLLAAAKSIERTLERHA